MFHDESFVQSFLRRSLANAGVVIIVGITLLVPRAFAQRGGGGGGGGAPTAGGPGRPGGVAEKDELKDFHRVMAVMATPDQRTMFNAIAHDLEVSIDQLQVFREPPQKASPSASVSDRIASLDQAIEKARTGTQRFLASFSHTQDSGLKDFSKRLTKADLDLTKEIKIFDQIIQTSSTDAAQVAGSTASLEKALSSFQNEQLALGREMSILISSSDQDLAFNLPRMTSSIDIAGKTISVSDSATVSRTSVQSGQNIFSLRTTADFSVVQQNVTGILRSDIDRVSRCGEHVQVQQASLSPQFPASLVTLVLHYERWICPPAQASDSPMEVADGNGTMEVKLTPSIEPDGSLHLTAEIGHVDADGVLRSMLHSGELGATLRDKIVAALLPFAQKAADLKGLLPPVAQQSAALRKAEFQDSGAGQLSLVLDGQLQLSEEQTTQFAAQLKQTKSAQGPSPQ